MEPTTPQQTPQPAPTTTARQPRRLIYTASLTALIYSGVSLFLSFIPLLKLPTALLPLVAGVVLGSMGVKKYKNSTAQSIDVTYRNFYTAQKVFTVIGVIFGLALLVTLFYFVWVPIIGVQAFDRIESQGYDGYIYAFLIWLGIYLGTIPTLVAGIVLLCTKKPPQANNTLPIVTVCVIPILIILYFVFVAPYS